MKIDKSNEIVDICNKIGRYSAMYYYTGISPITDAVFDQLKRRLREICPDAPILKQVGAPVPKDSVLRKCTHSIHMGSVANALDQGEFISWWEKMNPIMVVASLKVDGLSMDLEYKDGKLFRAITRGDGVEGEDVTLNVMFARDLPLCTKDVKLDSDDLGKFTGSVRAEVLLYNEDWRDVDPDAKNPRNAAAGLVRRKSNQSKAHYLRVLAHDIVWSGHTMTDWSEAFDTMEQLGFKTPGVKTFASLKGVIDYHADIEAARSRLDYEIDGVVIAIRDMRKFKDLGIDGEHCPRGQIAWKFTSMKAITTLRDVALSVGHTGAIIPTAVMDPVVLGGVTVSRASLSNFDEVARLGLGIGDRVEVARQGDVIPNVIRVVERNEDTPFIQIPKQCPVCGGSVGHRKVGKGKNAKDSAAIFCMRDECPAKSSGKLMRWVRSLDIKGMGDGVVAAMLDDWKIHYSEGITRDVKTKTFATPADLYRLNETSLSYMPFPARIENADGSFMDRNTGYGTARAKKLLVEINKTRKLTVDQFLGSLGVIHLGKKRVQLIREAWASRKGESRAKPDYLATLDGWFTIPFTPDVRLSASFLVACAAELGIPGIAEEIQKGLDDVKPIVDDLLAAGVEIVAPDPVSRPPISSRLDGVTACFTGCRMTSFEATVFKFLGGEEKSGVSKGLKYLVCKDLTSVSSKATKAREVGAEVIDIAKFRELLA